MMSRSRDHAGVPDIEVRDAGVLLTVPAIKSTNKEKKSPNWSQIERTELVLGQTSADIGGDDLGASGGGANEKKTEKNPNDFE